MNIEEFEALYMTSDEVAEYLGVTRSRIPHLAKSGQIVKTKGSIYLRSSVEAYRVKRGDKRGGSYRKER